MQQPHAAFLDLFEAYTGQPDAIGPHLNAHMGRLSAGAPLLVATGTDLVLFTGGGAKPRILNFRLGTRGFKELTAISHLGVPVPYLRRMYELDCAQWRDDAIRLKAAVEAAQRVNSPELWRDDVAAVAFRGRQEAIAGMTAYACTATLRVLENLLRDPTRIDFEYLRTEWLDVRDGGDFPIAMNDVMAATFALVFLDAAYRTITWLGEHDIAWDRAIVLISGWFLRRTSGCVFRPHRTV